MGYRVQPRRVVIEFEDAPGLKIVARSVSLGAMLGSVERAADTAREMDKLEASADGLEGLTARLQQSVIGAVRSSELGLFLEAVIEWNLEYEDGTPVPTTVEGVLALEDPTLIKLAAAEWRKRLITVPEDSPLPAPSTASGSSVEGSIPMAPL